MCLIILDYFSAITDLDNQNHTSKKNSIADSSTISFNPSSDEITLNQTSDSKTNEKIESTNSEPASIRKQKLLSVAHLFQLCYRTVIPNQPPTTISNTNLLPDGLSGFNPRPIGIVYILSKS